jgi:signal transduction histidine kinase
MISVSTALIIYTLIYFTSEQRVAQLARNYLLQEMVQEVHHWYAAEQSWQGFPDYFKSLHPPVPEGKQAGWETMDGEGSKKAGLVTVERQALLRYLDFEPGDTVPEAYLSKAWPVNYRGDTVAWVIPPEATGINLSSQLQVFLDNTLDILYTAIAVSIVISTILGVLFAKLALRPIESLNRAASEIAAGKLDQTITMHRNDEIGDLSRSFNKMSQDLTKADKQRRQLTADITHDLGTPIQVISGYVEMAREGELDLNQPRLDIIALELDQIQRLLQDMRLLAHTDAKTLSIDATPTCVPDLLKRVVQQHQLSCNEKQITLNYNGVDSLPEIDLDDERMLQVLGNLISNAKRYVAEGGQIDITTYCAEGCLIIKVSDSGCGIHPDDLPFIFYRFYRSDTSRSGTSGKMGLGLSISRGIIEMQGGTIWAESDGESGSDFIIRFPVAPQCFNE